MVSLDATGGYGASGACRRYDRPRVGSHGVGRLPRSPCVLEQWSDTYTLFNRGLSVSRIVNVPGFVHTPDNDLIHYTWVRSLDVYEVPTRSQSGIKLGSYFVFRIGTPGLAQGAQVHHRAFNFSTRDEAEEARYRFANELAMIWEKISISDKGKAPFRRAQTMDNPCGSMRMERPLVFSRL